MPYPRVANTVWPSYRSIARSISNKCYVWTNNDKNNDDDDVNTTQTARRWRVGNDRASMPRRVLTRPISRQWTTAFSASYHVLQHLIINQTWLYIRHNQSCTCYFLKSNNSQLVCQRQLINYNENKSSGMQCACTASATGHHLQTIQTIVENVYVWLVGLRHPVSECWGRWLEIFLLTYLQYTVV